MRRQGGGWTSTSLQDLLDADAVRRVRTMLAERPDAIVALGDRHGRFLWVSEPGSKGMFGRGPVEVTGHSRWDYVHPHDVARAQSGYARALRGESVRYPVRGRAADGSWVACASTAWSVTTPWGPAVLTITVAAHDEDQVHVDDIADRIAGQR